MTQSAIIPFDFKSNSVRMVVRDEQPWFVAADICPILGYANPRTAVANHCRLEGVLKQDTPTERGIQSITFINEGNLYRLIIKSRKPEAEAFEKKVMEEILPSIRKHDHYIKSGAEAAAGIWDTTIGTDGVHVLSELINKKIKHLPKTQQHATRMTLWKRLHARFSVPRAELIPASEMASAANFLAAYVFEGEVEQKPVQSLKPVVWPRPQRVGQPNGEGLPRTQETVEKILLALLYWGMDNLHDSQVLDSYHEAINDLLDLQVTGRTEMNEALLLMSAANSYINRWQGHGRRIRNVGG